jgi:V8-like Glu-specific endopeptidase
MRVFIRGMFKLLLLSVAFAGAIFGVDDRRVITPNSPWAGIANSTAVAVLKSNAIERADNKFDLSVDSLHEYLCPSERFRKEPSLQYACTGFLITPTLLVTAGHCMVNTGETSHESKMFCEAFYWYFGYQKGIDGATKTKNLSKDNLYNCKQIIYAVREEQKPFRDFALVELDRPVVGHTPLKLNSESLKLSQDLKIVGYPMGMPAQVAPNGRILKNDMARESFITNLDAFEGNSGSPVLNSKKEVVGILIGGTPSESFVEIPNLNFPDKICARMNICSQTGENCRQPETFSFPNFQATGSEVQRIAPILELLKNL